MREPVLLGFDIGTSSAKGVLVNAVGNIVATAERQHSIDRPHPGHVEMDPSTWWREFVEICTDLTSTPGVHVIAVGVSGMGPCVVLTDSGGNILRPAILYGIDARAGAQIERLTEQLGGVSEVRRQTGSALTSQSAGAKLAWVADNEPEVWERTSRFFTSSSWLTYMLTGEYSLDRPSGSQYSPMFDIGTQQWNQHAAALAAPGIELPELKRPEDVAGALQRPTAGIDAGTPVIVGTIDAWAEAVSVGAHQTGDLMLMYGTTMFLISTTNEMHTSPSMWSTVGAFPGTRNLAAGMATSGAITTWLRELFGAPTFAELLHEAQAAGPGARGIILLPYFAGERSPVQDWGVDLSTWRSRIGGRTSRR